MFRFLAFLFLLVVLAGFLPAFGDDFSSVDNSSVSPCQSVYNLIDTFQGVKKGFLKVLVGSSFAFGLLGGAYAVLRVRFGL